MKTSLKVDHSCFIIKGNLDKENISFIYEQSMQHLGEVVRSGITLDLSAVKEIDSSGVAFLEEFRAQAQSRSLSVELTGVSEKISKAMKVFSLKDDTKGIKISKEKGSFWEWLGTIVFYGWEKVEGFFLLIVDTSLYAFQGLFNKRGMRRGEFLNQSILIGMNALPIIGLISFLIGFILALQSAAQLRQFGASIYVADLIAISMTREMGPLMTAVVLAGRSGSSFTSEIANMVVTEETDALRSMGLNPIKYVVVPKVHAITVTAPMLTILSMIIGIAGSFLVGITYLGIGAEPFFQEVINALILKDIITGLVKSFIFAWIIVTVGAHYGLNVKGGSEGVGRATTASVVTSIFLIVLADSILGLVFYFGQGVEI
ncbi:MAG: MlaE family lipid ABC transporter permease subunit [bacterium]